MVLYFINGLDPYKTLFSCSILLAFCLFVLLPVPITAKEQQGSTRLMLLHIDGAIGPAVADYVGHGFAEAIEQQASLIILRLDTFQKKFQHGGDGI